MNPILGTRLFRCDNLNALNFEYAVRGSRINLAASPQGTAKIDWI